MSGGGNGGMGDWKAWRFICFGFVIQSHLANKKPTADLPFVHFSFFFFFLPFLHIYIYTELNHNLSNSKSAPTLFFLFLKTSVPLLYYSSIKFLHCVVAKKKKYPL